MDKPKIKCRGYAVRAILDVEGVDDWQAGQNYKVPVIASLLWFRDDPRDDAEFNAIIYIRQIHDDGTTSPLYPNKDKYLFRQLHEPVAKLRRELTC